MATKRLRLWEVTLRTGGGVAEHVHITTPSDNLSLLSAAVERLITKKQKDYTSHLYLKAIEYKGVIGE